jgi:hypothetical protein
MWEVDEALLPRADELLEKMKINIKYPITYR